MEINNKAPVKASEEIEIKSNQEKIWNTMINIADWTKWNPDIKKVLINDVPHVGLNFKWKSGPGMISSQILYLTPNNCIAWKGNTFGIKAIHIWNIEEKEGYCIVKTSESWEGLPTKLFKSSSQKILEKAIHNGLEYLKKECEGI